jgi:hypothetical protein
MNQRVIYRVLAVALLAAVGAHRYATIRRPAAVGQYHEAIRAAAASIPPNVGGWVGSEIPVPAQAIRVLAPNAIISRRYVNVENGTSAGLLFVHCSDAHDMAGHFPLRCYPAAGWDLRAARSREWAAGDLRVTGSEYEFTRRSRDGAGGETTLVVANCLLRPGGLILPDMNSMTKSIVGAGGQSSGAGQIQVYFDAATTPQQRDAAVEALLGGYRPLVDAVLADIPH